MGKKIFNPVVMAGGVGSRLWPLSRASFPKQFQPLIESPQGYSMLQQTIARLDGLRLGCGQVICNQDHRFLAAEQVRALVQEIPAFAKMTGGVDIVLEPMGRNTAPAVLVAALRLLVAGEDAPMLLLSADHAIADVSTFHEALLKAHGLAEQGFVVALGVEPTFACTGYGYIRQGSGLSENGVGCDTSDPDLVGRKVAEFVEKPNIELASLYLTSGDYLWNSGMFIVKPSILIAEARKYCYDLLAQCKAVVKTSFADLDFVRLPEAAFSQCQDISIDYAIMEHTGRAAVVPVPCGWSDVGDLAALKAANQVDSNGNVTKGDVAQFDTQNCLVRSENKLVATIGVEGLAIVETKDAVLVANLDKSQQIKELVKLLKDRGELDHHREVFRPWGSYDSVDNGTNYQVKRISVKPGAKLSLQRHQHRAEHWVVVEGTAIVELDGVTHVLHTNDSIYVPKLAKHSLANNTDRALRLIEVQSGSYLGEDDIERFEDLYGR